MSLHADMTAFRAERPDASPEVLAEMFIKRTTKADLTPLVAHEFWRLQREEIRTIESRVIRETAAGPQPARAERAAGYVRDLEGMRDLLDQPYRVRGSEAHLLRYMTREEHQARLEMLMVHRRGVDRSIELHREAIRLIDLAGVTCLDDLDTADLKAAA